MAEYHIDILENRRIEKVEVTEGMKVLSVKGGETYKAPVLIIATGANWRKLNVPGEENTSVMELLSVLIVTDHFIKIRK